MAGPKLITVAVGEELTSVLAEALRSADGWVQATGIVEAVQLRVAGEGVDPTRALRGRLTLASLSGPAGGPFGVVLSRATDVGLEVLAGELVQARSLSVTAVLLVTGEAAVVAAEPAAAARAPGKPAPAASSSWASAALATAAATRATQEPDIEPEMPKPGDLVQHFAFGLCQVLMGDDERLKIRDLNGPGRIREIRLDMLVIREPTDKDGKRMFKLDRRS